MQYSSKAEIEKFDDNLVLEEAAKRLQRQYSKEHRIDFLYGTFRFLFHEGRFLGVEDWPRNKRYISPR